MLGLQVRPARLGSECVCVFFFVLTGRHRVSELPHIIEDIVLGRSGSKYSLMRDSSSETMWRSLSHASPFNALEVAIAHSRGRSPPNLPFWYSCLSLLWPQMHRRVGEQFPRAVIIFSTCQLDWVSLWKAVWPIGGNPHGPADIQSEYSTPKSFQVRRRKTYLYLVWLTRRWV